VNAPERKPDDPALDAPWLADVRARLDESARDLDAATLSRLNQARQAALAAARPRAPWWRFAPWIVGATATAALALAVGLALTLPGSPESAVVTVAASVDAAGPDVADLDASGLEVADLDMLAAPDDLALYEDMEFYAWLDDEAALGG
jgi:anti-sigma-K factor RskA